MLQVDMHRIMNIFACSLQTLCLISLRISDPIESVGGPKIHFSTLIQDCIMIRTSAITEPIWKLLTFSVSLLNFPLFPCYNLLRLYNQLTDLLPQLLPLSLFSPMDFWSQKPTCSAAQATGPL